LDIYESYEVLELKPGVNEAEIKAQYRKLLRKWHPDMNSGNKLLEIVATERTAILNEAYKVIKRHEIPYTIPRIEASYYQGKPSHVVDKAKKTYSTNNTHLSKLTIDGTVGTGWKIAFGMAAFLFVVALAYNLIGAYNASKITDDGEATNENPYAVNKNIYGNSEVINTSPGGTTSENSAGNVDGVIPYNLNNGANSAQSLNENPGTLEQENNQTYQNFDHEEYEHRHERFENH
jgi:hypothetical protein